MTVLDSNSAPLSEGDLVRSGDQIGTYRTFRDDEPLDGFFQGRLTGAIIVEVDGAEETFPTFAVGADDVCWDVERIEAPR